MCLESSDYRVDKTALACRFDDGSAYGNINGIDDQSMGWSRYAQVLRPFTLEMYEGQQISGR